MSSDKSDSIQRRLGETTFIEPSGGVLTEQLIQKLRNEKCSEDAVQPKTFQYPDDPPSTTSELEARISEAWDDLEERWDEVTRDNELFGMEVSEARRRWILKLFEALGFDPEYQQANLSAGELEANLSHFGWPRKESVTASHDTPDATPPVLHTIRPDGDHPLDDGDHRGAVGRQQSPHDELQRYLNATDDIQWSIVTDGLKLRVLRDYYHTYTRGYVEFDLENIFTNRNYDDFRALYRLCHASRFIPRGDGDDAEAPFESLYQVALATGVKVGEDLQSNVVEALETLGNGFLNQEIRETLEEGGQEEAEAYYQDLLRIVYRLLFLLFAEQRGMMSDRGDLYTKEYSISALRERAERKQSRDHQTDLWEGLKVTFRLVGQGIDEDDLHVPGYNGGLFDDEKLEFVQDAACDNEAILSAIHNLTHVEQQGYQQRISYADLGVDEIGAVYESLLEFTPQLADTTLELDDRSISRGQFYLDDRGMERKETGSYYTKPKLVDELIESALKPVVNDRLADADTKVEMEEALLDLDVCDPAVGSGAFLIAANNYLGKRLAEIRTDSQYPSEQGVREAKRDVVQQCLYGVDVNPMAVELAKVSLWINSSVEDKPLSFLDHHLLCGNSIVGTNEELVVGQFPVDAYDTSGGRDWHVGNEIRDRIRTENSDRSKPENNATLDRWVSGLDEVIEIANQIEQISEERQEEVKEKKQLYTKLHSSDWYQQNKRIYDIWTSAFFWPMDGSASEYPSPSTIGRIRRNPSPSDQNLVDLVDRAEGIAAAQNFFHWELEFPGIFSGDNPGFDCILGNPPWEKVKTTAKEWFTGKDPEIANSNSKSHRTQLIGELKDSDPQLYERWVQAKTASESISSFIGNSRRFPLGSSGDINTYPVFTELCSSELLNPIGRSGIIVKTGIATDYHTRNLFGKLIKDELLVSLYDFVNKDRLFPDVALRERFCLLTTTGEEAVQEGFEFSFYNLTLDDLHEDDSKYPLSREDIQAINPNTLNCPVFETRQDRDIAVKMYRNHQILVNEGDDRNPWSISNHTMFHMSNDSDKFADNTLEKLQEDGLELTDNSLFHGNDTRYLPLWEAKLIQQFDHRFATFEGIPESSRYSMRAGTNKVDAKTKQDPSCEILPRYWVEESDFQDEISNFEWDKDWIFAFRNLGGTASNSRTSIGTIIPMHPSGDSLSLITFDGEHVGDRAVLFSTIFNSLVFDFALQQSLGNANFNFYIFKQLPMPSPDNIADSKLSIEGSESIQTFEEFLIDRGVELIWTSHSLDSLGRTVTNRDSPFEWNEDRRRRFRAEIDAVTAHLYGLTQDEFEYLLERFDILKELEEEQFGIYKHKIECLEAFEKISLFE